MPTECMYEAPTSLFFCFFPPLQNDLVVNTGNGETRRKAPFTLGPSIIFPVKCLVLRPNPHRVCRVLLYRK